MAAPKVTKKQKFARMLDGKIVSAVLYNGRGIGHGKYMTGEVDEKLVTDKNGKPMYLHDIGQIFHI